MYKKKSFLAIIPARGGSKGIPKKNIIKVRDKPLIQFTIEESLKSKYLDKIIVSTDDKKIWKISKDLGVEAPFLRPSELATDKSKTIDTIIHAVNFLREQQELYFDYVVLLQPTLPLRKNWHIDEAIEKIVDYNEESLVSITKVSEHPLFMRTMDSNGVLKSIINIESTVRRQDLPEYYKVNGAIYINRINDNLTTKTSLNDNKLAYEMAPEYSIDIDEPFDIEILKLTIETTREKKDPFSCS